MNQPPSTHNRRALLKSASLLAAPWPAQSQSGDADELALNYHLMHPGGPSLPGDPNAAFFLDGRCHLHYILRHPYQGKTTFCFVHVSSTDLLHWTWHRTRLQRSFTGHGMFSGTGFVTREGRPAAIYHGEGSGRNQIAIAKDHTLEEWEKPYPVNPMTKDGKPADIPHWDPDCFHIGEYYYAISGGVRPALMKSRDLKDWTYLGDFLARDLPEVAIGEDLSCPNFFPLGRKWMMLCISHSLGCRYYLGDWDDRKEQFVPQSHGRMNWRREDQSAARGDYRDFFAPESVLTPDGRRVMWAWCFTPHKRLEEKTLQSLPRELSLGDDRTLRIRPLRELASLRYGPVSLRDVTIDPGNSNTGGRTETRRLTELPGEAVEIRIVIPRAQAERKRCGVRLFGKGKDDGLLVMLRPETGTLRVGNTEAPFAVSDLPPGEDVELRIFVDKYLVEVFANDRQALLAAYMDYAGRSGLDGYAFGGPVTFRSLEVWQLRPTNQGYLEARQSRIWQPDEA